MLSRRSIQAAPASRLRRFALLTRPMASRGPKLAEPFPAKVVV